MELSARFLLLNLFMCIMMHLLGLIGAQCSFFIVEFVHVYSDASMRPYWSSVLVLLLNLFMCIMMHR